MKGLTDKGDTRVLVTGSGGQLGRELQRLYKEGRFMEGPMLFADRDILDVSSWSDVRNYLGSNRIDVVVNAAAYTNVDQAETDEKSAYAVNRDGVRVLAQVCAELGIYLVHVSTDYVFDGRHDEPYREDDLTHPIGVYGASKRAGEEAMLSEAGLNGLIVRTAWLYSAFGKNFVKTMIRLSKERADVHVVADQIGSPTWARDLAEALLVMIGSAHRTHRRGLKSSIIRTKSNAVGANSRWSSCIRSARIVSWIPSRPPNIRQLVSARCTAYWTRQR